MTKRLLAIILATQITITNSYNPEKTIVQAQKVWDDHNDQDGKRPDSVSLQLYKQVGNGAEELVETVVVTEETSWTKQWLGLAKYEGGQLITYSVKEANAPADYSVSYDKDQTGRLVVTNTYTPQKTSVTVTKKWVDGENQDGKRPDSVTLYLLANGVRMGDAYKAIVTADAQGKWTYTWKTLDKYANGQEIHYSVYEEPVTDTDGKVIYTASYNHDSATQITVTNSYTPEFTAVQTQKVWEDADNRDGLRPESITVTLLGDGEEVASAVLNQENGWTGSWTNLPKYDQGTEIQYEVVEKDVPAGYESAVARREDGQLIITNAHAPETTGVTVEKSWADENDNDGKRPDGIIVQLYADGSAIETGRIVLDASNQWFHAWESTEDMPLYVFNQGKLISYYVQEVGYIIDGVEYEGLPEGYVGSTVIGDDGYTVSITNTRAAEKLSVSVVKEWADADDNDGIRPDSVEMTLMRNGVAVETINLNHDNMWTYTWTDLYKYVEGTQAEYTVVESTVNGYGAVYSVEETDGHISITVTNTHDVEMEDLTVTKVWKDNNDEEDLRPDNVSVQLYKNGEVYGDVVKLSADNNWKYTVNLPVYEDGERIVWSVKETSIPRYYTVSYNQNTLTITNTIQSRDIPNTGDYNNLWMWVLLMGGSTAGIVTVLVYGKKRKYAE